MLDASPAGCAGVTSPPSGGWGNPSPARADPAFGVTAPDFPPFVGLLPLARRCKLFSTCIVLELVGSISWCLAPFFVCIVETALVPGAEVDAAGRGRIGFGVCDVEWGLLVLAERESGAGAHGLGLLATGSCVSFAQQDLGSAAGIGAVSVDG